MTTSLTQCRRTRHHHLRLAKRTFDSPSDRLAHIIRSQFTSTRQSFRQASLYLIVRGKYRFYLLFHKRLTIFHYQNISAAVCHRPDFFSRQRILRNFQYRNMATVRIRLLHIIITDTTGYHSEFIIIFGIQPFQIIIRRFGGNFFQLLLLFH